MSTFTRIAIVGLGAMGWPIARHLAGKRAAGSREEIVAVEADPERAAGLAAPGLTVTADPDGIAGAQVLFLCLPDGAAVRAALFEAGLAGLLDPGAIVVDLSTTAHADALAAGRRLGEIGKAFVDAPVSGAPAGAEAGTLTVMCGGEAEAVEAVRPLLARIGTTVLHMGPQGAGQLAKTVNNVLYDINIAALAEVLPMAVAMGLDPDKLGAVVTTGTGRSYAAQYFVPRILRGEFDEGYPLAKAYKDLVSASHVAAEGGFPMPVTGAATATYQTAMRRGHGDRDKGAMVLPFEELLGVEVRSRR